MRPRAPLLGCGEAGGRLLARQMQGSMGFPGLLGWLIISPREMSAGCFRCHFAKQAFVTVQCDEVMAFSWENPYANMSAKSQENRNNPPGQKEINTRPPRENADMGDGTRRAAQRAPEALAAATVRTKGQAPGWHLGAPMGGGAPEVPGGVQPCPN